MTKKERREFKKNWGAIIAQNREQYKKDHNYDQMDDVQKATVDNLSDDFFTPVEAHSAEYWEKRANKQQARALQCMRMLEAMPKEKQAEFFKSFARVVGK